jgi:hypothetical protein
MADFYPSEDTDNAAAAPDTAPNADTMPEDKGPDDTMGGDDDSKDSQSETALLPKSILAGKEFKPGDELALKVVHIYNDEVEVQYASEDEKKPDDNKMPGPYDSAAMKSSMGKLDAMAK